MDCRSCVRRLRPAKMNGTQDCWWCPQCKDVYLTLEQHEQWSKTHEITGQATDGNVDDVQGVEGPATREHAGGAHTTRKTL